MAFPSTLLSLAAAVGSNFLNVAFGGVTSLSAGLNLIITDLLATETKLGTGPSTPVANSVLVGNGTGTSAWLAGLTTAYVAANAVTVRQLEYAAATDINNGTSMATNGWTDVGTNQSFTVADVNSTVVIELICGINIQNGNSSSEGRVTIDSAGTPQTRDFPLSSITNGFMSGIGRMVLTGLSAGTHTVKLQAFNISSGGTIFCRASSINYEGLWISVVEYKR